MDSKSTRLLWDLRVALVKALTESDDTVNVLEQLRAEGWSVYLVVDGQSENSEDSDREALPLRPPGEESLAPGDFRIDTTDLKFLRSLGIDPTRTLRPRRKA